MSTATAPPGPGVVQTMVDWAAGDAACEAAVELVLNSRLSNILVPAYVRENGSIDFTAAKLDLHRGALQLSRTEIFLLTLADNISFGPAGVHELDLRQLWSLGDRDATAFIDALGRHLVPTSGRYLTAVAS